MVLKASGTATCWVAVGKRPVPARGRPVGGALVGSPLAPRGGTLLSREGPEEGELAGLAGSGEPDGAELPGAPAREGGGLLTGVTGTT